MNDSFDPIEDLVASHGGRLRRAHAQHESAWRALRQTKITLEFVHWLDQKAHLQRTEWRNSPIGIEFDLISNLQINAFATANSSLEVVGINAGLIIFLQNVFWALLSSDQFLPTFGSAKTESKTAEDVGTYISKTNIADGWGHLAPRDPERIVLAAELSRIAELFVFDHEVAHLTYGHVWHKKLLENRKVGIIFEYGSHYSNEQFRLMQALEFDADEGATAKSIGFVLATLGQIPIILKTEADMSDCIYGLSR